MSTDEEVEAWNEVIAREYFCGMRNGWWMGFGVGLFAGCALAWIGCAETG